MDTDKDEKMDLLLIVKFLVMRQEWFVDERFEVAIEHHSDDFDNCIGEVEYFQEVSVADGKHGATDALKISEVITEDFDAFMR
jgi:hypothetical protein